jgi:hypothetical protein
MKELFKIGDKLEASEYHVERGIEYVTITSINKKTKIYHWEADEKFFGGKVVSGYRFDESKPYISKEDKREIKLKELGL